MPHFFVPVYFDFKTKSALILLIIRILYIDRKYWQLIIICATKVNQLSPTMYAGGFFFSPSATLYVRRQVSMHSHIESCNDPRNECFFLNFNY